MTRCFMSSGVEREERVWNSGGVGLEWGIRGGEGEMGRGRGRVGVGAGEEGKGGTGLKRWRSVPTGYS